MPGVLDGIRVIELATWGFIPSAGVALADWGAEVIKVEHPSHGDPMRGLVSGALTKAGQRPVSFMFQTFSRNKASVGIDLTVDQRPRGALRLVASADVFLTNYLTPVRRKLGVDVDDLLAVNPRLVYARGTRPWAAGRGSRHRWLRPGVVLVAGRRGLRQHIGGRRLSAAYARRGLW